MVEGCSQVPWVGGAARLVRGWPRTWETPLCTDVGRQRWHAASQRGDHQHSASEKCAVARVRRTLAHPCSLRSSRTVALPRTCARRAPPAAGRRGARRPCTHAKRRLNSSRGAAPSPQGALPSPQGALPRRLLCSRAQLAARPRWSCRRATLALPSRCSSSSLPPSWSPLSSSWVRRVRRSRRAHRRGAAPQQAAGEREGENLRAGRGRGGDRRAAAAPRPRPRARRRSSAVRGRRSAAAGMRDACAC